MTAPAGARSSRGTLAAALAGFAVLRLVGLTRYPPWTDETWSLEIATRPLRTMFRTMADEQTQQPLFGFLLWVWTRIGPDSLASLRMLPAVIGIATAVPMLMLCRAARLPARATTLALMIGAGSQMLVAYSAELRAYSLYAFLGTLSLALWLRARDEDAASLAPLTAVNIALVYTHLFGALVVFAEWLDAAVGARKSLRALTLSAAVVVAAVAPWEAYVAHRARLTHETLSTVSWIARPLIGDILDPFRLALVETPWLAIDLALLVAAGGAIAAWAIRARTSDQRNGARAMLLATLVPVALVFAASIVFTRSSWVARYLITIAPPLCVMTGAALDALIPRTQVAAGLALWPALFALASIQRGDARPRYDLLVQHIAVEESGQPTIAYSTDYDVGGPLRWAGEHPAPLVGVRMIPSLAEMPPEGGWLAWSEAHPPAGLPPTAAMIRRGYRAGASVFARGMGDSIVAQRFTIR